MGGVAILDYGVGNVFSLVSSLQCIGAQAVVTRDAAVLESASHILLPGVGAFGDAMQKLTATGLIPILRRVAERGKPLLGICLGMQLLFEASEEYGVHDGLGLLPGKICALEPDLRAAGYDYKVPHMGWNALALAQAENPLMANTQQGDSVYFVHSFYAKHCDSALVATAEYGVDVPACVARENVYGCQFHPEKSGAAGLAILRAFAAL